MKKFQLTGIFRYSLAYLIHCSALFLLFNSCDNMEEHETDSTDSSFRQFQFISGPLSDAGLTNINCYLFRKGIFYKRYTDITLSENGSCGFNVPSNAELYFLTNIAEPSQLAGMKEGVTTREKFLSYHTSATEEHSATRAPSVFYSAKVTPDIAQSSFNVSLGVSLSRIDLDVSDATGMKIERIYTRSAAGTTSYFSSGSLSHAAVNSSYSFTFDPPETGKAEDIFRVYESDSPVTFIIEGILGDTPVTISTPVKQIERNKIYRIRIQSEGVNAVSSIAIEDWKIGDEITATDDEKAGIKIDVEHSELPADVTLDDSRTVADITCQGVKEMLLAFLTKDPLQLNSVEGLAQDISAPEISMTDGKYLTKYKIALPPNYSPLTYCVTLNLKSVSEEKSIFGKITLNINPYPYKIKEVTMGGMTWMAFNSGTSNSLSEQIYPELYGYSETKDLYENKWLVALGNMVQWADISCPVGYRLPTSAELKSLLYGDPWDGNIGGGSIPDSWSYGSDRITAKVADFGTIKNNGISVVSRYLEITNRTGSVLYFPLGGMKEAGYSPDQKNNMGDVLCLWSSDSAGANTAYVYKLIYENSPRIYPEFALQLDKTAYAYVRCVKTNY